MTRQLKPMERDSFAPQGTQGGEEALAGDPAQGTQTADQRRAAIVARLEEPRRARTRKARARGPIRRGFDWLLGRNRDETPDQRRVRRIMRGVMFFCLLLLVFVPLVKFGMMMLKFGGMKPPVAVVTTTEVQAVTWTPGIEAVGTAKATRGVDLAVEVGGVVKIITFNANDRIEAGQLLIQIDDAVEQAELIAAEANIKLYENELARTQSLRQKGVAAQSSLDDARAKLDVAKSTLARLKAVTEKKAIIAPFAGIVGIPHIDVGQYVQPGAIAVTLQDLSRIKVDFTIPEQFVKNLAVGQTARFGTVSDKLELAGQIVGIDPKADPLTKLVAVRAELDNPEGAVRPGQFLRARVELPPHEGVVALPQTAVVSSLYGDYVYVLSPPAEQKADAKAQQKGKAAPKGEAAGPPPMIVNQTFVTTGMRDGAMVEIRSGLKPGQIVVTSGQNKLQNGASVRADNTVDPVTIARQGAEDVR